MGPPGRGSTAKDVVEGGFTLIGGGMTIAIAWSILLTTLLRTIVGHPEVEMGSTRLVVIDGWDLTR